MHVTEGKGSKDATPLALSRGRVSNSRMLIELATLFIRVLEVTIIFGFGVALVLSRGEGLSSAMVADHYRVAALGAILYATLASATGSYDVDVFFSSRRGLAFLPRTWGATGIFLVTLGFILKASADISREWALLWFVAVSGGLWLLRVLVARWLEIKKRQGLFDVRTAVYGGGVQAVRLIDYLNGNARLTLQIVGVFDDRHRQRDASDGGIVSIGDLSDLISWIRAGGIDQVIVALPWASETRIQQIVQRLALTPVRIRLAPDLVGFSFMKKPYTRLGEMPVLTLFDRPISGLDQSVKWLEDQLIGWILLIVLSPLLLATAIAIKLDSPGPVFFRQPREGFNDRQFRIWKFRSMYEDRGQIDEIVQAHRGDDRVTRVGAFLRRTSIDELPQLFNVLEGDMSLVGPRPHAPSTKAGERLFKEVVDTYAARHRVKPGITGWAQVCGWRGPTDTEEKLVRRLDHDIHYIDNWSPWFDLYILARTAVAAIAPRNAF